MAVVTYHRAYIIAGIALLFLLYSVSYSYHSEGITAHIIGQGTTSRPPKDDFVSQALLRDVSDPFDISAISKLCRSREPRDDVVISCEPGRGGVGNIRSYLLHCTRFAMEIGASMILPGYHRRSTTDLAELFGPLGDFEHFFDRQHFVNVVQTACPHMRVYDMPTEEMGQGDLVIPHWNDSISAAPSPWRQRFDAWFDEAAVGIKKPALVQSGDVGTDQTVMHDGMEFYYSFGRILQFRPDARRLAVLCMSEMENRFHLGMKPEQNFFEHAYLGAHLRTGIDAVKAGWNPDFDGQTDWYINQALQHELKIIYAAGGNEVDLVRFAEKASKMDIIVVTKKDLLLDNDLRELHNMLWDQRGLVDFEVLLRASQFAGYGRSSFSQNIAIRRHSQSSIDDPYSDPDNHFADELSVAYGRPDAAWEEECIRTMWP